MEITLTKNELLKIIDTAVMRDREYQAVERPISATEARRLFGSEFTDAVRLGRLSPVHVGPGKNGTHRYLKSDILALRTTDQIAARLQLDSI